jgi:hypothetical protein
MTNTKLVSLESVMEILLDKKEMLRFLPQDEITSYATGLTQCVETEIQQLPTQEAQEWISIQKEIPEE